MGKEVDDLEAIADSRCLVHCNMTEETRRYRYHKLREAGYNSYVARRVRDWHTGDYESILRLPLAVLGISEARKDAEAKTMG